jgi:hypothetical protein
LTKPSAKERGIYSRPSAAIERGSGFFIPGLEGSRIRFFFGITVLLADAASHFLAAGKPGDVGQLVSESLAAFYGALLLLQGSIELGVERGIGGGDASSLDIEGGGTQGEDASMTTGRTNNFANALRGDETAKETIQRMAETIISFTPTIYLKLVEEDVGVLYSIGTSNDAPSSVDADEQNKLIRLANDAVSGSKGGRVALPSEHPVSKLLPKSATRCILVQKVDGYKGGNACLVLGSDKLLPSFTKNDLRWIGQLAEYNNMALRRE